MSALPIPVRLPSQTDGAALAACAASKSADDDMMQDTVADLRQAVRLGTAVHYGDGSPPQLARDAIMAAVMGASEVEERLEMAMRASEHKTPYALRAWERFYDEAVSLCARELVDRMVDGQKITFGAIR